MSENDPQPMHPIIFFISRIFILIGMVLFFAFTGMLVGMFAVKFFFGIDAINQPGILTEFNSNVQVMNSLKLIQVLNTIGGFLIPAILFPRALQQYAGPFTKWSINPKPMAIVAGMLVILISIPLVSWLIQVNESYHFPPGMEALELKMKALQSSAEELTKAFIQSSGLGGLIMNLFIVALLPAICEEFFFRGALMRFLMLVMRNKHLAVILTGFIFSLMHGEFYGLLPRFVLGVFLGYIAWYSGSIWPAVAAHLLNNGMALLAEHYHWGDSGIAFLGNDYVFPYYAILGSSIVTIGILYWMSKRPTLIASKDEE